MGIGSRRFRRPELWLIRPEMKPKPRLKNSEMLPGRDKRRNKRQFKKPNSNLMKLSIKLNSIDSPPLPPNRKQRMPRISKEPKRDSKPMLRESRLRTEREKPKRGREELKRQLSRPRLKPELNNKESLPRKPRRSSLPSR